MKNKILLIFAILFISFLVNEVKAQAPAPSKNYDLVSENDAVLYPNPVFDGKFYVKTTATVSTVEVLNIIGQSIKKITNETGLPYNILVKLPECENGIYMVRITFADNKTVIKKLSVK